MTAILFIGVLLLVGLFRTSSALASAYGIAVATTMVVDGILAFIVVWKLWHWPLWRVVLVIAPLVVVDFTFFSANLLKLLEGAWAPLLFGAIDGAADPDLAARHRHPRAKDAAHRGAARHAAGKISRRNRRTSCPAPPCSSPARPTVAPTALLHNLKHNKVLHEHNVILTIITTDTPRVTSDERVKIERVSPHFSRVALKFGYMESPNVPKALAIARKHGWQFDIMSTSFFLSRRALKPAAHSGMPRWQDRLFIALAKSASDATDFFQIPTGRVVEVGTQVTV